MNKSCIHGRYGSIIVDPNSSIGRRDGTLLQIWDVASTEEYLNFGNMRRVKVSFRLVNLVRTGRGNLGVSISADGSWYHISVEDGGSIYAERIGGHSCSPSLEYDDDDDDDALCS